MASHPSSRRHIDPQRVSVGKRWFAALAVAVLAAMVAAGGAKASALRVEPVALVSETGRHVINAEIADTPQTRATGLMFRRNTEPFSTNIIEAGGAAKVVLEVPAGTARRLKLKRGDRLEHASVGVR